MKATRIIMLILLCSSFIPACKKTSDNIILPVLVEPVLSKLIVTDTTLTPPHDTVATYLFFYDAQKRPSMMQYFEKNATGDSGYYQANKYEYNSNDALASRSIQNERSFFNGIA